MIVVVVHAESVCDAALTVSPSCAGVEPLRSGSSRERGERIHDVARAARPVQPKIDVVLRAPPPSATPAWATYDEGARALSASLAKVVNEPQHHRIRIARG